MEIIDYIDWDEGRDFPADPSATDSGAVNVCQGCDCTCDRLTVEPIEGLLFCDECMGETMAVLAREAKADPQQARLFPVKEVA